MFLPHSLYDAAGGFPKNVNRCVDVEFMARCRENGGGTYFDGSAKVSHRNISGLRHCLVHATSLGCGSARVRKFTTLRGDIFVKIPLFTPLLVPGRVTVSILLRELVTIGASIDIARGTEIIH